ncbi:MAG: hypothetical protein ACI4R9_08985 [Kiritimatiellia bacterium]
MKKPSSRAGSAILVVLGMTAFLLVSAIAFSAYMRYARLPSSYLRRSSSTRLLAKAAMARAIDAVDIAVNNNPHPGVGDRTCRRYPYMQSTIRNVWTHRVLIGTNLNLTATSPIDANTVSPLCLEALAYIPPPLVNEARFYSRRSPTAHWHSLDYDAGRYTFCALDVSDYFDVNRLMADIPRSSAPNRRVSLAYLFETGEEHTSAGSGAAGWDRFMENFRTLDEDTLSFSYTGSKMPLVSLADFNLALHQQGGVGELRSPFADFITGNNGSAFYGKGEQARINGRLTFVADGWFPQTADTTEEGDEGDLERYDLNDGQYQPFPMELLARRTKSLSETLMAQGMNSAVKRKWLDHFSLLDMANLCDYLDTDHVPVSLAIPTTERTPMICGVAPNIQNAVLAIDREQGEEKVLTGDETTRELECTVVYRVNATKFASGFGAVSALVTYPFAHPEESAPTFKLGGRCSLFLSSEPMKLRTSASDVLHLTSADLENSGVVPEKGLINIKLADQTLSVKSLTDVPEREEDAVEKLDIRVNGEAMSAGRSLRENGNELLRVTYRWQQTLQAANTGGVGGKSWQPKFKDVVENPGRDGVTIEAHCGLKPLTTDGTVDNDFKDDAQVAALVKSGHDGGKDVTLNLALWLRITADDGGKKVVDMVPACLLDDKTMNNVSDAALIYQGLSGRLGKAYPLLRFDTDVQFRLSVKALDEMAESGEKTLEISPKSAIVGDPRFNYAPEHWFGVSDTLSAEFWVKNNGTGRTDRRQDIFMATSDAGYMQSIYEMAMLPQFGTVDTYGDDQTIGNMVALGGLDYDRMRDSLDAVPNQSLMWYAYDPIEDRDLFEELPWTSAGNGFKVTPYSNSTNILMSVFANTPIDWKRASTNDVEGGESYYDMAASEFNSRYAFNAYSSDTKLAWRNLEEIAGRFSDAMRDGSRSSVADAFADLGDWTSAREDRFCGVNLDGVSDVLWDVDRKFLYGFWKDCFAAKQQLFLIFVRAEPVMMGSGTAGQIPPQLGARAVALVWRDPTKVRDDNYPHRTRILFYRQFE